MNAIVLMSLIVFIAMTAVGGQRGSLAFIGLFINIGSIFLMVHLIGMGMPPRLAVLLLGLGMLYFNTLVLNGDHTAMKVACLSGLLLIVFAWFVTPMFLDAVYIHGFSSEELHEMDIFSMNGRISYRAISLMVVLVSMMGAVIDAAIAVATAMDEIRLANPLISPKQLMRSGMNVSQDILVTTVNTLLFAFFGQYIGLVIWVFDLHYSWQMIVNAKIITGQVLGMCLAGGFALLTLPVTAFVYRLQHEKAKK
ncbi:YibE/F family protein [Atopobacter phocae]|uniref:YibE/F family protein n=1 Tax=Atopobacter phocae TaxID=136492 RepID=UPI00046FA9EE|nr:YibE/F family protein [Atopobacter phocae]